MSQSGPEDLANDELLRPAPRDKANRPTLGGIPLLKSLGRGGMASVYYGFHPRLHYEVAVKVLLPEVVKQDPTIIRRFFNEAQVAVQISSAHLVRVFDVNEEAGLHYMVQEFVAGPTAWKFLADAVADGFVGLSEAAAVSVVTAAARGLVEAHRREIVHRDLKPENILIPLRYGEQSLDLDAAKLADLGLAKYNEPGVGLDARANISLGTPGFVAPEQALDAKDALPQSDVFSMGATIYALLAGRAPFTGSSPVDVIVNTARNRREPITDFQPDLSSRTVDLIHRCLLPKLDERFLDAIDLLQALEALPRSERAAPRTRRARIRRTTQVLAGGDVFGQKKLSEARSHLQSGNRASAAQMIQEVLEKDPDNFEARQLRRRVRGSLPTQTVGKETAAPGPGHFAVQCRLTGHDRWVRCIRFSLDGRLVVTSSDDKTARVWNAVSGQCEQVLEEPTGTIHHGPVLSAAFSADGRRVVTASQDHTARVWDLESGAPAFTLEHPSWVNSAEFSPDGTLVVTACLDGYVRVWEMQTGSEIQALSPHARSLTGAAFSPDGRFILTASNDKTAAILDAASREVLLRLRGHAKAVNSADFSRDGARIVTASDDGTARVWDATTGEALHTLEDPAGPVTRAALGPDGAAALTATDEAAARLWDVAGRRVVQVLSGHTKPIRWVAFSPDGQKIATAAEDLTACIWARE